MKKKLKIILKEKVENLGELGETKEVAAGYARNYLVPAGLALYLKDPQAKQLIKQVEEKRKEKEIGLEKLKEVAVKLEGKEFELRAKATSKGKLYAKIGPEKICQELKKIAKIELKPEQIKVEKIEKIGEAKEAVVRLGSGIEARFKVKAGI